MVFEAVYRARAMVGPTAATAVKAIKSAQIEGAVLISAPFWDHFESDFISLPDQAAVNVVSID